ncbi:MAG TPA: alpha/beta hydrolase [Stellaceae bacterium]|jgi:pimeloyl-ACP methyl ester carboxylesterase
MAGEALIAVGDAEIEVARRGTGQPLLFLPGEDMLEAESAFVAGLAERFEVIIPSPPGFGRSSRPDWLTAPSDVAYLLLSLLKKLGLGRVPAIGCSLGGWIAAEMAIKDDACFARLVLIAPYGVKLGRPSERDFVDLWQLPPQKREALKWRDSEKGKRDMAAMGDDELGRLTRNLESFARFGWEPYLHNPKLKHLLYRVAAPTLLLWGEEDGIAGADYARGYAKLIPGARVMTIADAAHYPHLEQPDAVLRHVSPFLAGAAS